MATEYRGRRGGRTGVAARLMCGIAFAALMGFALPTASAQDAKDRASGLSPVAQAQSRDFDIPAQPLTSALTAFGDQAGLQVTADTAIVSGRTAPAVSGRMTQEEALRRLMAGSGIAWRYVDAGTVALERATANGDSGATPLDPITVEGKTESAYGPVEGYRAERSASATKTDTPIRDIPNSIQVIPRQIIVDQQAIGLEEVLDNAAGVTFLGNESNRQLDVAIRGFSNASILRNGFNLFGIASTPAEVEVANLERVEVVRGPSVLYGQVEPGGSINLVTKKPLDQPSYSLTFQAGNRGLISPIADVTGPVTEDGSLLYRVVALYRREDSFQDYDESFKRVFVAPSATWRPTPDTDLTVRLEYTKDKDPY
ncbi:MAG: TonB-dependent receptor plug domain-containing protein, partial [Pseudomonadota bacterium]